MKLLDVDTEAKTDTNGYLFMPKLGTFSRQTVGLDSITLPDPAFKDKTGSKDYLLRPSQIFTQQFPIIMVGEIDAMVYGIANGKKEGLSSIILEVIDEAGNILASAPSEFDGFNIVQEVPFGTHRARIKPEQLQELGYCPAASQPVTVTHDNPFVSIEDIVLYPSIKSLPDQNWLQLGETDELAAKEKQWNEFVDLLSIEIDGFGNLEPHYFTDEKNEDKVNLIIGPLGENTARMICSQTREYGFKCERAEEFSCYQLTGEEEIPLQDADSEQQNEDL